MNMQKSFLVMVQVVLFDDIMDSPRFVENETHCFITKTIAQDISEFLVRYEKKFDWTEVNAMVGRVTEAMHSGKRHSVDDFVCDDNIRIHIAATSGSDVYHECCVCMD